MASIGIGNPASFMGRTAPANKQMHQIHARAIVNALGKSGGSFYQGYQSNQRAAAKSNFNHPA